MTQEKTIQRLPFPPEVVIPLAQHIGALAKAIVEKKQEIVRGEAIADPGGFVSVAMHAPLSGTVTKIDVAMVVSGVMTPAVFIKGGETPEEDVCHGAPVDVDAFSPREIVAAVQSAGLVGLGGAAFPTHVKLTVPEGKSIDTVIVNGCECEPCLTTDHRVMLEQMDDLLAGIRLALRATGAPRALIGIETNKPDAIAALREAIPEHDPISVAPVRTKYPQGAERMLIRALLNREVPSGGLPSDVSAAVFNVATLAQMGALLPKGQGLIERVVTVTGGGVERPGNYVIPMGTSLRFVLDYLGFKGSARQVILGGPMMGPAAPSLDIPVTKGVSGILVLTEDELAALPKKVFPCIRCGKCVQVCPMFLNPSRMGLLARNGQYELMEQAFHLNDCFECGCCAYTCPSNIPLVQYFRMAKTANRKRKAKK